VAEERLPRLELLREQPVFRLLDARQHRDALKREREDDGADDRGGAVARDSRQEDGDADEDRERQQVGEVGEHVQTERVPAADAASVEERRTVQTPGD
jgi:hypothetical protein